MRNDLHTVGSQVPFGERLAVVELWHEQPVMQQLRMFWLEQSCRETSLMLSFNPKLKVGVFLRCWD